MPTPPPRLYPDLDSIFADAEARRQAERMPLRWTPAESFSDRPEYALAVIGLITIGAARRVPVAWSGAAIHSDAADLAALLLPLRHAIVARKGDSVTLLETADRLAVLELRNRASKLWAGHTTAQLIWESNLEALAALRDAHEARRAAIHEDDDPGPLPLDAQTETPVTVTGYDRRMVGRPLDDGFSIAQLKVKKIGARPAIELLALIGASECERHGHWIRPSQPQIPDMSGIALRDHLDLQRLLALGAPLPLHIEMAGKRSYLAPGGLE